MAKSRLVLKVWKGVIDGSDQNDRYLVIDADDRGYIGLGNSWYSDFILTQLDRQVIGCVSGDGDIGFVAEDIAHRRTFAGVVDAR